MSKIVYITRPITRKKDEGSKNFMVDLATALEPSSFQLYFLTVKGLKPSLPSHIQTLPIHSSDSFSIRTKLSLLLFLLSTSADIIHTSFILSPLGSILIKSIVKIRQLSVVQTIPSLRVTSKSMIKHLIYGTSVVCMSSYTKQLLQDAGIEHVRRIPAGVSLNTFKPLKKKNKIVIVGELHRLKSYSLVKKIVPQLAEKLPKYKIVLAFRTANKSKEEQTLVQNLREQFPESKKIAHVSVLKDAPRFLGSATLVVHPALDTRGKFDYPLVLLESLAAGTPVIVSPILPLSELSQYPGALSPRSNTSSGFLTEIVNALGDYESLSKSARKSAREHFSIAKIADEYKKIYEQIR